MVACRYINHSCAPNCVAEVVTFERGHKIIISSNRRIQKGEEVRARCPVPTPEAAPGRPAFAPTPRHGAALPPHGALSALTATPPSHALRPASLAWHHVLCLWLLLPPPPGCSWAGSLSVTMKPVIELMMEDRHGIAASEGSGSAAAL